MSIVNYNFSSFLQCLLFLQSSESGLFQNCHFTTDVYNALQIILVFLTDVPKLKALVYSN